MNIRCVIVTFPQMKYLTNKKNIGPTPKPVKKQHKHTVRIKKILFKKSVKKEKGTSDTRPELECKIDSNRFI